MTDLAPSANSEERTRQVEDFELRRLRYGFLLLLSSIGIILAMFVVVAVSFGRVFDTAAGVISLITTTTTVIGTLVGFYFGSQVGSAGAARADAARQETVDLAVKAAKGASPTPVIPARPVPANGDHSPVAKSPKKNREDETPQQ